MGRAEGAEETLGVGRYAGKAFEETVGWARPVTHISSHFATVVVMCFSKSA